MRLRISRAAFSVKVTAATCCGNNPFLQQRQITPHQRPRLPRPGPGRHGNVYTATGYGPMLVFS